MQPAGQPAAGPRGIGTGALACGAFVLVYGFAVLYFNEAKTLARVEPMHIGIREATHVPDCKFHPENEGKLIYMVCPLKKEHPTVETRAFARSFGKIDVENAAFVEEHVEMYQWHEFMGEDYYWHEDIRIRKVKHARDWFENPKTCPKGGHLYKNPRMEHFSTLLTQGSVYLGELAGFELNADQVRSLAYSKPSVKKQIVNIPPPQPDGDGIFGDGTYHFEVNGGYLYALKRVTKDRSTQDLWVGDYRVQWVRNADNTVTVVAQQKGRTLVPWTIPKDMLTKENKNTPQDVHWLEGGSMSLNTIGQVYMNQDWWQLLWSRAYAAWLFWMGIVVCMASPLENGVPVPSFVPHVGGRSGDPARPVYFVFSLFLGPAVCCLMLTYLWGSVEFFLWALLYIAAPFGIFFLIGKVHGKKNATDTIHHDAPLDGVADIPYVSVTDGPGDKPVVNQQQPVQMF